MSRTRVQAPVVCATCRKVGQPRAFRFVITAWYCRTHAPRPTA